MKYTNPVVGIAEGPGLGAAVGAGLAGGVELVYVGLGAHDVHVRLLHPAALAAEHDVVGIAVEHAAFPVRELGLGQGARFDVVVYYHVPPPI